MTISSEHERIAALARLFGSPPPCVSIGVGDDAAVLTAPAAPLVWSVDASVEGVHFRRDLMSLEDAGYRATMAALSDLAAMGARPLGILGALTLRADTTDDELLAIARGQLLAATSLGTAIIGGNLARSGVLTITTTVLGSTERAVSRGGASAGEVVVVAGPLGLAATGFALAERGFAAGATGDPTEIAMRAFRRPAALCAEGEAARRAGATAMVDVSDGLAADVSQLARASGVTVELDREALVDPTVLEAARVIGGDPLHLALTGGEDYALVATLPASAVPSALSAGFRVVGRCVTRTARDVIVRGPNGEELDLTLEGFDHFR